MTPIKVNTLKIMASHFNQLHLIRAGLQINDHRVFRSFISILLFLMSGLSAAIDSIVVCALETGRFSREINQDRRA
jgi:hypothetical protein